MSTPREPTPANLRADAVVKRRRANWPLLSQEVPVSQARYLPKFRKGGGQEIWEDGMRVDPLPDPPGASDAARKQRNVTVNLTDST